MTVEAMLEEIGKMDVDSQRELAAKLWDSLEVVPAPNTSHLLAIVQSLEDLSFEESMNLQAELNNRINILRTAVSESIHRRKTPGLSFQIVPRAT